ncbi:hypothetical protein PGH12_08115 [Chryseobacterium wangxinyae]|uniref:hypothetical protein n=1 Tax=Chryseobacterium sp. CY350 TaxID=2997336 RepID=UPI002270DCB8|nr:hypothetical protein [Chryseobacterium sp. CY350]MCY0977109.1 hypothetical protein [Chryseobacterium sp. CY350]WBZ97106.1 hypothetical protein PGH12_08115 [Chryseobacterium sp. CY350]
MNISSSKKYKEILKERKKVTNPIVYVNIHEWGGYALERCKFVSTIPEFKCGLKFQLERFNKEKKYNKVHINVSISEIRKHQNIKFVEQHSDNILDVVNEGMDFSGYSSFYNTIKHEENCFVILTNSSVECSQDLFLDGYIDYMKENKDVGILGVSYCTKMIQTFVKNNFTPHLQSFFYLTTSDVLKEIVEFNRGFPGEKIDHKLLLIRKGEIKMSNIVLKLGYNLAVVTEDGNVYKFCTNSIYDNAFNAWKLKWGDVRLQNKIPNKINPIVKQ